MGRAGTREERLAALVAGTYDRQSTGRPVHEWDLARLAEGGGMRSNYLRLEQYMTTDLLTVNEDESIELVANLMDWHRIQHVPVEANHPTIRVEPDADRDAGRTVLELPLEVSLRGSTQPEPVDLVIERSPYDFDDLVALRGGQVAAIEPATSHAEVG